jgi:hypothetical protein
MTLTNVDDKLLNIPSPEKVQLDTPETRSFAPEPESVPEVESIPEDNDPDISAVYEISAPKTEEPAEPADVDEYGTEIAKQEKVYTQAEVDARINEAIRKRLKERAETPVEPQYQPQYQPQAEVQPAASDDWEAQLESFIESTLSKREQKAQAEQWQRQEQEAQANFEIRFNQGMAKYQDFEQVVMGKPLTPQMVIATRGMSDPAAFIYAAAKTQAPELDRISKIGDPYAQAIELGRLEERMRKARSTVSKAPRPIEAPKGDVSEKVQRTWSIDEKLRHAESESKKERMRGKTM